MDVLLSHSSTNWRFWGVIAHLLWRDDRRLSGSGAWCLGGHGGGSARVCSGAYLTMSWGSARRVTITHTSTYGAPLEPLWNLLKDPHGEANRRCQKNVMIPDAFLVRWGG